MCSGSSKACLRALPDSQHDQVDDLLLPVEHAGRAAAAAPRRGASTGVRAQAACAAGPGANASSTSAVARLRDVRQRRPPSGERTSTVRPVVATSRRVSARDVAPVEGVRRGAGRARGRAGPRPPARRTGCWALMYREYVSPVSPDTPAGPVRPAPHRHPGRGHARGARDARGDAGQCSRPRRCLTRSTRRAACSTRWRKAGWLRVRASTARVHGRQAGRVDGQHQVAARPGGTAPRARRTGSARPAGRCRGRRRRPRREAQLAGAAGPSTTSGEKAAGRARSRRG